VTTLINQMLMLRNIGTDLDLNSRHQHAAGTLNHQLIERAHKIDTGSVIGDYLQHQAYSFPADHPSAEPFAYVWKGTPPFSHNRVIHNIRL
jgi:hypothetical protein